MENKKPPKTSSQRQVYKHDNNKRSTEECGEARGGMRVWGEREKHGQTQVRQTDQRLEERRERRRERERKRKSVDVGKRRRENRSEEINTESERGRASHQVDGQFSDGNI